MIECNEIAQVALELKMKFEACSVLEAADLDRLVELIEAVNTCALAGGTTIDASQVNYDNSTSGATGTNVQDILDEILAIPPVNQDNQVRVIDLGSVVINGTEEQTVVDAFNALPAGEKEILETENIILKINIITAT